MGPPSLDGGEPRSWLVFRTGSIASMGPPSLDGGEPCEYSHGWGSAYGFNGAPVSRRGGVAGLASPQRIPFALQWGPRLSTGGSLHSRPRARNLPRRFNGAPVSRRGGGYLTDDGVELEMAASMGPPSLDGGERENPSMGVEREAWASMGPPSLDGGELQRAP